MDTIKLYNIWKQKATKDPDLIKELENIENSPSEIDDRFYKELEFGTGGLRGVIGAGTNRMNVYTVAKATQGFANYILKAFQNPTVAISYDSRIKSDLFSKTAACCFAANGIKVHLYRELMPTPLLSFAVRELHCAAGVMVTASHNPSKYNGYKAYGPDGCQLSLSASAAVLDEVNKLDPFNDVKTISFDEALKNGTIEYISDAVIEKFLATVEAEAINPGICKDSHLKVIYTPLNGTGNKPVRAILKWIGIENVSVVKEQELPDGNFPTAPYPNPEIREAFDCALKMAETEPADLLLATDPDCDRVGIAVKNGDGYQLISGNQVGALLLDYVLKCRTQNGTMPKNPVAVTTVVTSTITKKIAKKYNVDLKIVLTGFKFIGGVITELEKENRENDYVFGFEESYGYLSGGYVRDKDAVDASMLICEMACYYKKQNKSLLDVLEELSQEFGYYCNEQISFTCEGETGMERMAEIMKELRENTPKEIAEIKTLSVDDYELSKSTDLKSSDTKTITLPKSNVLAFHLENGSSVTIRPSGTEPKIKVYLEAVETDPETAHALAEKLKADISRKMGF